MSNSFSESYKKAGVDVTAGYEAVRLMKEHIAKQIFQAYCLELADLEDCLNLI